MDRLDIHKYEQTIKKVSEGIQNSTMPEEVKTKILDYDRYLWVQENTSTARRITVMGRLKSIYQKYLPPKKWEDMTKEDIEQAFHKMKTQAKAWTVASNGAVLKKFSRWLEHGTGSKNKPYPEKVSWIPTRITNKQAQDCRPDPDDLVTPQEVRALIQASKMPRDKCFISMLAESGTRISEIGNLRIGDLKKDMATKGWLVSVSGKTGRRAVLLLESTGHIQTWLNNHPDRRNPQSPLFTRYTTQGTCPTCEQGKCKRLTPLKWHCENCNKDIQSKDVLKTERYDHISYAGLCQIIERAQEKCGIKKRLNPHLWRHSRATHLLASGDLNETQVKKLFGWSPDSKMLSTYAHLTSNDANQALARMHGLLPKKNRENAIKTCPSCESPNSREALYCYQCGLTLNREFSQHLTEAENQILEPLARHYLREAPNKIETLIRKIIRQELRPRT